MLLAGIGLLLLNPTGWNKKRLKKISEDIFPIGIAVLATYLPAFLNAYALKNLLSSKSAFIKSINPFVMALYAYVLFGEKLTFKKVLGIILGFLGTLILMNSTSPLEETLSAFGIFSYPELAQIFAVTFGAFGWLQVQKLVKNHRYSALEINEIVMLIVGPIALISSLLNSEIDLAIFAQIPVLAPWLLYTVVAGNMIGYPLYTYLLKHNSATFVSLAAYTIPFFVAIYGYFLFGEIPTQSTFVASFIILIGMLIFYIDDFK